MRARSLFAIVVAGLFVAACNDVSAPLGTPDFAKGGKGNNAETNPEPTEVLGEVPPLTIVQSADAPPLTTYSTSFTAVQGEASTFVVFYDNPWSPEVDEGEWFMKLDVPMDATFMDADGNPAFYGDTVQVTVEIDSTRFFVQFGPHGSVFVGNKPATLSFNLRFAELNGDDPRLLDVWYQPYVDEPWLPEPTQVDKRGRKAVVSIDHFSNYAIAW